MTAIYKKELRSYFHSVIGELFIAIVLFFSSLYFTVYNLLSGYPYVSIVLSSTAFLLLIAISILTMRSLTEERKQKTDQLIFTAPVSISKVVIAKYLAILTVFMIPILIVCIYPLILSMFGTIGLLEAYTAILGYVLFGAACIAIGLFISSITENQIIAAVLSFAVLFTGYLMSGICSIISTNGNLLTKFLSSFDLTTRLDSFFNGTFSVTGIVYFLSIVILFLFFTVQSIQKRRWSISAKHIKTGAYSTGLIAVVTAVIVVVNLAVSELPTGITALDVTSQKLYSITDTTKKLLNDLDEDVTIYVLNAESSADTTLAQTLSHYEDLSSHIRVEYKDPVVTPNFASSYTSESISLNSLIVESEKRSRVIDYSNIYEQEIDYTSYSATTTGYDGEGQLTSAVSYVTSDDMPKVYMIGGHNEVELGASFTNVIVKENVDMETIQLIQHEQIPEDAECIFLLGPIEDLSADDTKKIKTYLNNGGKAVITATWNDKARPNFDSILSEFGVSLAEGMIMEGDASSYYQSPFLLLPNVAYSDITASLTERYVFMPYAQGIVQEENLNSRITIEPLLSTSEVAFSKVDVQNAATDQMEEGDIAGPFTTAALITKELDSGEAQVALFASEELFTENADSMVSGANLELFGNTLSYFVDHEASVSIPVKSYNITSIMVNQTNAILFGVMFTLILPLFILAAGIIIWLRRRNK